MTTKITSPKLSLRQAAVLSVFLFALSACGGGGGGGSEPTSPGAGGGDNAPAAGVSPEPKSTVTVISGKA